MTYLTRLSRRRTGGVLAATLLLCLALVAPAQAEFGASSFVTKYHEPTPAFDYNLPNALPPLDSYVPVRQAGGHGDFTTDIQFNRTTHPITGAGTPDERVKDVEMNLPVGFYGNPQVAPTCDATLVPAPSAAEMCPVETQVGAAYLPIRADLTQPNSVYLVPIYNIVPEDDDLATFAFTVGGALVKLEITARSGTDNGLRVRLKNINQGIPIFSSRITLWGVPADPKHDFQRMYEPDTFGAPSPAPRQPFLTQPTRCDGELKTDIKLRSWETPDKWVEYSTTQPAMTGCDQLKFEPGISLKPQEAKADSPSAYDVDLSLPQSDDPDGLSTPTLRKASVKLPEGVTIAPPSAHGLDACKDDQTGIGTEEDHNCPEASKIGSVKITTPVLAEPLTGDVILREPKPGNLFRLLIVARGPGIVIKLPGDAIPDKQTGQITAVFDNTPQLPFSLMELRFKGGPRAPLSNPKTCGTKTTTTELTSWGGPVASPTSSFDITECSGGFAPTFEAGMVNPLGGAFSPFTMTIRRADGQEDIANLAIDMPPGLLGMVASVPQCAEWHARVGTCGEESRVGTTTVEAGAGSQPYPLQGKVFLGGPYKGAPFSLSVVVRAIAGPFDLGTVVVRAPINVDAANAKIGVPSDPLPTILEGVPFRLRTINITIDRPGFMFNPTNCDAMQIGATITGTGGTTVTRTTPYQARGCANLPLNPSLSMGLKGPKEIKDGKHPGIVANLVQPRGESGLKKVAVKLPLSLALDPDNAQALCKPAEAAAKNCPAGSIVGRATAVTPALNQPLTGPIYFVENTRTTATGSVRRTLPKLWLALRGEVPLDLYAESTVVDDHLVATFNLIPDAPISSFQLAIEGGKNGILAATESICEKVQTARVTFEGQNGKRIFRNVDLGDECGFRVARTERLKTGVRVTVSGLGAGRLEISGKGIKKTRRTILSSSIARVTAKLSKSGLATVRRNGKMASRVTVKFTPKGTKKAKTTGAKVTFRR